MKRLILLTALLLSFGTLRAATSTLANAQVLIDPATGLLLSIPTSGSSGGGPTAGVSITAGVAGISTTAKDAGTTIQMKSFEYTITTGVGSTLDTLFLSGTPGVKYVVTSVEVSCSVDRFVRVKYASGTGGVSTLAAGHMVGGGGFEKLFPVHYKCTTGAGLYLDNSGGVAGNLAIVVHYYEE